ncbi:unnamed protein product [Cylicocyclus nassatus]|uniref:SCP domain-containing protein n=1 Tax=Cylicocyclus nassatus TaxID=53992 RepID=A0AA36H1G6_CYLNA|nr:unnamed protein product [Cylicocyclus nassatus]
MKRILLIAAVIRLSVTTCQGPACADGGFLWNETRQILTLINDKRSQLARGMVPSEVGTGPLLPKAKDMFSLGWNCSLEKQAADAITWCPTLSPSDGQGYAFFQDYFYDETFDVPLRALLNSPDIPLSEASDGAIFSPPHEYQDNRYKSYANLMRSSATQIGCAWARCVYIGTYILYCITDAPDVEKGQLVYERGSGICDCSYGCDRNWWGLCKTYSPKTTTTTTTGSTTQEDDEVTETETITEFEDIDTSTTAFDNEEESTTTEEEEDTEAATTEVDTTIAVPTTALTEVPDIPYCSGGSFTESQITCKILSFINHYRFALANGMQQNGRCSSDRRTVCRSLPEARDMNKLRWSCDLERIARAAITNCSSDAPNTGHGYVFLSSYDRHHNIPITSMLHKHHSAINHHSFSSVYGGVTYLDADRKLKGYANLMRSTATEIGCARQVCHNPGQPSVLNLYCITNQPDLKHGDKVYEAGSGSCDCSNFRDPIGLCTVSRPIPLCVEPIFPDISGQESDTICGHGDMTDALRILILDMHNIRRAQLAGGQLRYHGRMLPTASNMNRLIWSCALEQQARDYIATCPKRAHRKPSCLNPAENFYRGTITSDLFTFEDMVKKAIREWWDVYQYHPNPDSSAIFTDSLVGTPVESYTRMAWAQTREIGCSIARCGDEYVQSCRYQPEGNIVNNPMYNIGTVCSECYTFGAGSCGSGGLCG